MVVARIRGRTHKPRAGRVQPWTRLTREAPRRAPPLGSGDKDKCLCFQTRAPLTTQRETKSKVLQGGEGRKFQRVWGLRGPNDKEVGGVVEMKRAIMGHVTRSNRGKSAI
ncbi:unnamed protein product [Pleuronectes platessa]|uniref:Uncharacterized protein n=1 Tax=Pleuronectes platessa TaxID=8262 RepID=A0A9N7YHI9_PLEPL|nr:unnamed protein product [Pleuronectes platessa]